MKEEKELDNKLFRFSIRDDDVSYWSSASDIESVYRLIWHKGFAVSFAVIPFSVRSVELGNRALFSQETAPMPLHMNPEIVDYLKSLLLEKKATIMLHGFTHQYSVVAESSPIPILATQENLSKIRAANQRITWLGEYRWKTYSQLSEETKIGLEYLEDVLMTKIEVFVPPSNDLSKAGAKAISERQLHISGSMRLKEFNRSISSTAINNWLKKAIWKLRFGSTYFPDVLDYATHKEIDAVSLVPDADRQSAKNALLQSKEMEKPFVIATHYWEVLNNEPMITRLNEICNMAGPENSASLNELFA